ncbi:MAG: hypothetical protein H7338_06430, partial [Candidatus Sericytochromatia bacterium]|nr:hypothetical protein [Candidatus Sericytochromatia bacterium]
YRQPPGRLGMMTDDRELTLGLRRIRTSDAAQSGKPKRETTFTVHSRS